MDLKELKESLRSESCPHCGRSKKPGRSLCPKCYFAVPLKFRHTLYDPIGKGYTEAIEAALAWLKESGNGALKPDLKAEPPRVPMVSTPPRQPSLFGDLVNSWPK